jgi:spoIIIJ-associated protein
MNEQTIESVKKIITELMLKMGFDSIIEISTQQEEERENIICNVTVTQDSNLLIGQYGINLQSLQHIARLMVRKEIDEKINFIVDINSYRQEKNQSIVDLAKLAADQALQEGRAIVLRPMSPYERRLVHLELSKDARVTTESIGEGESRKVVVKPKEII